MTLLIGSLSIGLILSLLAFGILISFRVVAFEDLTVDGSFALGGATAAILIVGQTHPLLATGCAALAGAAAGAAIRRGARAAGGCPTGGGAPPTAGPPGADGAGRSRLSCPPDVRSLRRLSDAGGEWTPTVIRP